MALLVAALYWMFSHSKPELESDEHQAKVRVQSQIETGDSTLLDSRSGRKRTLRSESGISLADAQSAILERIHFDEFRRAELLSDETSESGQSIVILIAAPSEQEIDDWKSLGGDLEERLSEDERGRFSSHLETLLSEYVFDATPYRLVGFSFPSDAEKKAIVLIGGLLEKDDWGGRSGKISGVYTAQFSDDDSNWKYKHLLSLEDQK